MSKIVLDEKEVNELMDTFDFQKSLYLQELQKLNTSSQKNVEDLKILILKFNPDYAIGKFQSKQTYYKI